MTTTGVTASYLRALHQRDLRLLVAAFLTDQGASWAYSVVLTVYVYERTGSVGWLTAMAVSGWVVGALISGHAGVFADRYDRRRLLVAAALASAVVTVGIAVLVGTDGPLWLLILARVVLTATCAPTRPASGALLPDVVAERDLVAANGLFGVLESLVVVLGPALGGLFAVTGEPVYGVLLDTASFLVAAALYARLSVRSHGGADAGGGVWQQWREGLATLAQHRRAVALIVFLLIDGIAMNGAAILNAPLAVHLGSGTSGLSLLLAASSLGGVLAAPVASRLSASPRLSTVTYLCIVTECVPLFLSFLAPNLLGGAAIEIAAGAGMVVVDVLAFTSLQRDLPREVLGRALATVEALCLLSVVLATVATNACYAAIGLGPTLAVIGFGMPVLALLALPGLRAADRESAGRIAALASRVELLEALDIFAAAPRATLETLAAAAQEQQLPAGATLIAQGDEADALWILESGEVAVSFVLDGLAHPLPSVSAPAYVGELGVLNAAPRSATVTTATPCRLLRIGAADFTTAVESAPVSPLVLAVAGERLRRTGAGTALTAAVRG